MPSGPGSVVGVAGLRASQSGAVHLFLGPSWGTPTGSDRAQLARKDAPNLDAVVRGALGGVGDAALARKKSSGFCPVSLRSHLKVTLIWHPRQPSIPQPRDTSLSFAHCVQVDLYLHVITDRIVDDKVLIICLNYHINIVLLDRTVDLPQFSLVLLQKHCRQSPLKVKSKKTPLICVTSRSEIPLI